MDVLLGRRALDEIERYDKFRVAKGYSPVGDAILDALKIRLGPIRTWVDIPAPVFRIRAEPTTVKRLLLTVRSKVFKVYVLKASPESAAVVVDIRHPAQRPIERRQHPTG